MNHPAAEKLALQMLELMQPYCRRIQIAGSVRRQCAEVRDLELVAIPLWEDRVVQQGLVEVPTRVNLLHEWALSGAAPVRWVKTGTPPEQIVDWEPKPDGKYWRGICGNVIHLDLFLAQPDNWGLILAIRTGCKDFSQALVQEAARQGYPSQGGFLRRGDQGAAIPTPEEGSVFALLGLEQVAPSERSGREALRRRATQPTPRTSTDVWDFAQLEARRREVYALAGEAGYPSGITRRNGVDVNGDCLWGYAIWAAEQSDLDAIELRLRARLRDQPARRAA